MAACPHCNITTPICASRLEVYTEWNRMVRWHTRGFWTRLKTLLYARII